MGFIRRFRDMFLDVIGSDEVCDAYHVEMGQCCELEEKDFSCSNMELIGHVPSL